MQYLIQVTEDNDEEQMYAAPVADDDARYLKQYVAPTLQPLSMPDYMHGPAVLLHTFARFSYILDEQHLYWCIEWNPGLLVLRFAVDGSMGWTAIRSPVPGFGGQEELEADVLAYDDDAENHQRNLVFTAWNSLFDKQYRKWYAFVPATQAVAARHEQLLQGVNTAGEQLQQRYADTFEAWAKDCRQRIADWAGEGVRLGPDAYTSS
ncbi:hypothetical protein IGB42_04150 [Andreprevotia sp. IGB-42]|uniref:hypothetical protein n=1 Tax=Andreprevotia sp. IGB-42 TaxID=2497473 RepID=UPI00135744A5|nr:hypothetical protein [Andreprevotia sp. IGB-42]KAF0811384.1 hypothetical protein IGB42_04150 [Andreprevotia sp. IGB-42]